MHTALASNAVAFITDTTSWFRIRSCHRRLYSSLTLNHILCTMSNPLIRPFYSIIISVHPEATPDYSLPRAGDITVDWVDFSREKSIDYPSTPSRNIMPTTPRKKHIPHKAVPGSSVPSKYLATGAPNRDSQTIANGMTPDDLSLQPLLGHFPGPNPLGNTSASGISSVGRGIVHLFRHAPPPTLIASLDAHPVGESSSSGGKESEWAGDKAEGEDGSLVAILAVPAWMRPADFLEFIGGWATCLEGVRMIR